MSNLKTITKLRMIDIRTEADFHLPRLSDFSRLIVYYPAHCIINIKAKDLITYTYHHQLHTKTQLYGR